jgi:hypothetical protein
MRQASDSFSLGREHHLLNNLSFPRGGRITTFIKAFFFFFYSYVHTMFGLFLPCFCFLRWVWLCSPGWPQTLSSCFSLYRAGISRNVPSCLTKPFLSFFFFFFLSFVKLFLYEASLVIKFHKSHWNLMS